MELQSISILPNGSFVFWHKDGDLFWGHSIEVGEISIAASRPRTYPADAVALNRQNPLAPSSALLKCLPEQDAGTSALAAMLC